MPDDFVSDEPKKKKFFLNFFNQGTPVTNATLMDYRRVSKVLAEQEQNLIFFELLLTANDPLFQNSYYCFSTTVTGVFPKTTLLILYLTETDMNVIAPFT